MDCLVGSSSGCSQFRTGNASVSRKANRSGRSSGWWSTKDDEPFHAVSEMGNPHRYVHPSYLNLWRRGRSSTQSCRVARDKSEYFQGNTVKVTCLPYFTENKIFMSVAMQVADDILWPVRVCQVGTKSPMDSIEFQVLGRYRGSKLLAYQQDSGLQGLLT